MLSGNAQEVNKRDTTVEMKEVMVTARSEIRKLKESAMPISGDSRYLVGIGIYFGKSKKKETFIYNSS